MARAPNYGFEKRKKEQERKAKKDAKREDRRQRRLDRDGGDAGGLSADEWRDSFVHALERVLDGRPVSPAMEAVAETASAEQLQELTTWLAQQPAGLDEAELGRRLVVRATPENPAG